MDSGINITYDSKPDYDDWGYDEYWTCEDWRIWYTKLKDHYGKSQAYTIWTNAWLKQDIWESNYSWCKYDTHFTEYMKAEGINVGHVVSNIINTGGEVLEDVTGGIVNTTKLIKYGLPFIVIGVGLFYVLPLIKASKIFK